MLRNFITRHKLASPLSRPILARPSGDSGNFNAQLSRQKHRKAFKKPPPPAPQKLEPRFRMEWPKLTFFGDSITRQATEVDAGCWGSMIEAKAGHYFDLDFRGFEGYNTRWALELVTQLFPKNYLEKVEQLTIFFGHNDSWQNSPLGLSPAEFEENYREIVRYFKDMEVGPERMILVTPTWYHHESFEIFLKRMQAPPSGKSLDHARLYHEAVVRVGKENDIEVVDMFNPSRKHEPLEELFCDGVHYSRRGAKMFHDLLFPVIQSRLEAKYQMPLANIRHVPQWMDKPEVMRAFMEHKIQMQNFDGIN